MFDAPSHRVIVLIFYPLFYFVTCFFFTPNYYEFNQLFSTFLNKNIDFFRIRFGNCTKKFFLKILRKCAKQIKLITYLNNFSFCHSWFTYFFYIVKMAQSPCPHRIIDDMVRFFFCLLCVTPFHLIEKSGSQGYAFCMGGTFGTLFHGFKGYRNAPRGTMNRFIGCGKSIAARAPGLGGNFAIWGLFFSSYDCLFLHARRKDDQLNAIMAGAATGGTLAFRAGPANMCKNALLGGVFLALIEGLGILLSKQMQPMQQQGPISPYSTYSPAGPGRHVGELKGGSSVSQPPPADSGWVISEDDDTDIFSLGFDILQQKLTAFFLNFFFLQKKKKTLFNLWRRFSKLADSKHH
ncbi:hypothetical protein RFI_08088 [Reticulomyxa filosa]|uniref:Uncharacterized protein n=1 Tax=Reticulomyxa filosa TaxID=46433 RepID=X6NSW3_RETFI|nr:hypothetical protein RFI_08088 [Reticulomyxa filosa]|eukprot:ETO29038.1 hypothetical protein RFI_08088 [Reticulomyxa filosa]